MSKIMVIYNVSINSSFFLWEKEAINSWLDINSDNGDIGVKLYHINKY